MASCSVYSLQTILESAQSDQVAMISQEHNLRRQTDEALSHGPVACEKK